MRLIKLSIAFISVVILSLTLTNCGGGDDSPAPTSTTASYNLTGSWNLLEDNDITGDRYNGRFLFTQSGNSIAIG